MDNVQARKKKERKGERRRERRNIKTYKKVEFPRTIPKQSPSMSTSKLALPSTSTDGIRTTGAVKVPALIRTAQASPTLVITGGEKALALGSQAEPVRALKVAA
jgi:hypothetical protein